MDPKPTNDELLDTCESVHAILVRAWKFAPDCFARELVAQAILELEDELDCWETTYVRI